MCGALLDELAVTPTFSRNPLVLVLVCGFHFSLNLPFLVNDKPCGFSFRHIAFVLILHEKKALAFANTSSQCLPSFADAYHAFCLLSRICRILHIAIGWLSMRSNIPSSPKDEVHSIRFYLSV
jgi:hypothetical protein